MTKAEKNQYIDDLAEKLKDTGVFYLADTSELTVEDTSALRRECFKKDIQLKVVKNTLLEKALQKVDANDYGDIMGVLSGPTSIMFTEVANAPAKVIKEFRKSHDKPVLKAAWIESAIYVGDDKVNELADLKSREELIGDIISLLQSPAKNVIGSLQSGGDKVAGILKTLSEREG